MAGIWDFLAGAAGAVQDDYKAQREARAQQLQNDAIMLRQSTLERMRMQQQNELELKKEAAKKDSIEGSLWRDPITGDMMGKTSGGELRTVQPGSEEVKKLLASQNQGKEDIINARLEQMKALEEASRVRNESTKMKMNRTESAPDRSEQSALQKIRDGHQDYLKNPDKLGDAAKDKDPGTIDMMARDNLSASYGSELVAKALGKSKQDQAVQFFKGVKDSVLGKDETPKELTPTNFSPTNPDAPSIEELINQLNYAVNVKKVPRAIAEAKFEQLKTQFGY